MEIHLGNLFRKRAAESRSITAENPTGAPGMGGRSKPSEGVHPFSAAAARELGTGWKVTPCLPIPAGETLSMAEIEGPGVVRHIWLAYKPDFDRDLILRVYYDGAAHPSIETPMADFFCNAWARHDVAGVAINVNPDGGYNCFLPIPFRQHCRMTVQNDSPHDLDSFYYTVNYTLEPAPEDALYLHAQWRRSNPLPIPEHTLVDGIEGQGHWIGAFMAWQQNCAGWWGEGEIKMYLDGDGEHPAICGTGTEDYFGGAWCFHKRSYSAPFMGYRCVQGTAEEPGARHAMYRFHVHDPVFFKERLRVTMQALGWRRENRYMPLADDVASVAYWYQSHPGAPFPPLPDRNAREAR